MVGFFLPFLKSQQMEKIIAEYHVPVYFARISKSLGREEMAQRRGLHEIPKIGLVGPIFANWDCVGTKIAGLLMARQKYL